jgi:DNA modification methylase
LAVTKAELAGMPLQSGTGAKMTQALLFEVEKRRTKGTDLITPQGYRGLAAFHKYWGKKPVEYWTYLIENLTREKEVVLDPFLGSGLVPIQA